MFKEKETGKNQIKITVVTAYDDPIEGVTVTLFGPDMDSEPLVSTTEKDGIAIFEQITMGTYSIKATRKGFDQAVIENISIKPGESKEFKIVFEAPPILEEIFSKSKEFFKSVKSKKYLKSEKIPTQCTKIPVFYGTNRKRALFLKKPDKFYGSRRGKLQFGRCWVSIPKDHKMGHIETPSLFRLEFRKNPKKHGVLLDINPFSSEDFFKELKLNVEKSKDKEAFVFVHGFKTTFEQAALRTAQFAYDLGLETPIMFSWPSKGTLTFCGYTHDENNIQWTVPHLKFFLEEVSKQSGASRLHLIAHSMGNRALTDVVKSIAAEIKKKAKPVFNEIILTAPDIDADIFKKSIAPQIIKGAKRITLYASAFDKALSISKSIHGYPRAGDAGEDIVVVKGVDTIDVSPLETDFFGHTYFATNRDVLNDLFMLLKRSLPPDERHLIKRRISSGDYWIFRK